MFNSLERWRFAALALLSAAALASETGAAFRDPFADGSGRTGPVMIPLPAGEFLMGSGIADPAYNGRNLPHRVVLSPFAMCRFSVTTAEFAAFLNDLNLNRSTAARFLPVDRAPGLAFPAEGPISVDPSIADLPVTGVTWTGALAYASWLSDRTGQVYVIPSEAQWEYAARAGAATVWPWGDEFDPARINCDRPQGAILPERLLAPNRFGLRGMPGNVWEWLADCYDLEFYLHSPVTDPVFLDPACPAPMIRGGSFRDPRVQCSPGYRINYFAQGYPNGIGFRVVRRMSGSTTMGTAAER